MIRSRFIPSLAALACAVALLVACAPDDPVERVADLRAGYVVEVNPSGLVANPNYPEPEIVDEEMMEGDESEDADAQTPDETIDEAGDEMIAEEMEPESYDIVLDLLIKNDNRETLPELTVDIIHLDATQTEKGRLLVAFDVADILPGASSQFSHELKGIPYEEGDMFTAEVCTPVPPEERGEYPEFGG